MYSWLSNNKMSGPLITKAMVFNNDMAGLDYWYLCIVSKGKLKAGRGSSSMLCSLILIRPNSLREYRKRGTEW